MQSWRGAHKTIIKQDGVVTVYGGRVCAEAAMLWASKSSIYSCFVFSLGCCFTPGGAAFTYAIALAAFKVATGLVW
jgi:hypothetical protein